MGLLPGRIRHKYVPKGTLSSGARFRLVPVISTPLVACCQWRGAAVAVLLSRTRHKYVPVASFSTPVSQGPGKTIPPPQLQPNRSASIRIHRSVLMHRGEGVRYLTSGPYEAGSRVSSDIGILLASPGKQYHQRSAPPLLGNPKTNRDFS